MCSSFDRLDIIGGGFLARLGVAGGSHSLGLRHGQRLLQLRNGSVQRLCLGLATSVLHEGRMPC